jgi:tetratricopeptide (TPR) repeat protein
MQGQLQEAEEILSELEQVQSIVPGTWINYILMSVRGKFLFARGEWMPALGETRALLNEAKHIGDLQGQSNFASDLALITLELNRYQDYSAWAEVEGELKDSLDITLEITKSNHPRYRLAIVHARQGYFSEAHNLYEEERRTFTGSEEYMDKMMRLWTEYELAYAEERWHEAVAVCESLVEICERSNHRWDWARRLIDLADAVTCRKEPGDIERAREIYQQSLDMFTEMGAPGYIKVLEERLGLNH